MTHCAVLSAVEDAGKRLDVGEEDKEGEDDPGAGKDAGPGPVHAVVYDGVEPVEEHLPGQAARRRAEQQTPGGDHRVVRLDGEERLQPPRGREGGREEKEQKDATEERDVSGEDMNARVRYERTCKVDAGQNVTGS